MKIDIEKVKKAGGRFIEFDPTKAYLVIFNGEQTRNEDAIELMKNFNGQCAGLMVEGDVNTAIDLYEIKQPKKL